MFMAYYSKRRYLKINNGKRCLEQGLGEFQA